MVSVKCSSHKIESNGSITFMCISFSPRILPLRFVHSMQLIGEFMPQIHLKNRANYWSIETVSRAICVVVALSPQESNFVTHIHSSDF